MKTATTLPSALLIVDMINALAFPQGDAMLRFALPAAERIARLKARIKPLGVPVIYANDNYGQWRSDFRQVVTVCGDEGSLGAPLVKQLHPEPDDYFVLKPQHSAFHETPLEMLLRDLGTTTLLITGIAADSCVLATAMAAHMREFRLFVPADCVASETAARKRRTLKLFEETLDVDTRDSSWITRRELDRRSRR